LPTEESGKRGGRPRLDLTPDERVERVRSQTRTSHQKLVRKLRARIDEMKELRGCEECGRRLPADRLRFQGPKSSPNLAECVQRANVSRAMALVRQMERVVCSECIERRYHFYT